MLFWGCYRYTQLLITTQVLKFLTRKEDHKLNKPRRDTSQTNVYLTDLLQTDPGEFTSLSRVMGMSRPLRLCFDCNVFSQGMCFQMLVPIFLLMVCYFKIYTTKILLAPYFHSLVTATYE